MRIATVGSRKLSADETLLSEAFGFELASNGYKIISGGATGADQAFVKGASRVEGHDVMIYLPWETYESHSIKDTFKTKHEYSKDLAQIAAEYRSMWTNFTFPVRKLLTRNAGIALECAGLISLTSKDSKTNGTQHVKSVAKGLGRPVLELSEYNISISDPSRVPTLVKIIAEAAKSKLSINDAFFKLGIEKFGEGNFKGVEELIYASQEGVLLSL